jgi:hypothetical protein
MLSMNAVADDVKARVIVRARRACVSRARCAPRTTPREMLDAIAGALCGCNRLASS